MCADAHLDLLPPLEPFAPQGAGSFLLLGARLARGGAPAKEGRGRCPQDPLYCARDFSRRISTPHLICNVKRLSCMPTVSQGRPRRPRSCPAAARAAQACPALGSPQSGSADASTLSAFSLWLSLDHALPCNILRVSVYLCTLPQELKDTGWPSDG